MRISYDLDYFKTLSENEDFNVNDHISESCLSKIIEISQKVSSTNYQKTPTFRKRGENKFKSKQFKPTQLNTVLSEKDKFFNTIITLLNKMTGINIENTKKELDILILEGIEKDYIYFDAEKECPLVDLYFNTIIGNGFFINTFVELTSYLSSKFDFFNDYIKIYIKKYEEMIVSTNTVDAEKDYNEFCYNNKKNDKTKTLTKYFCGLLNEGVIKYSILESPIEKCIKKINDNIYDETKKQTNEMFFEYLIIITSNIKIGEHYCNIIEFIKMIVNVNVKKTPGITRKVIFKLQDVIDEFDIKFDGLL